MRDTKVLTSVSYGTCICMDACDTLSMMRGLSLSLISYCESVKMKENHGILVSEANNGRTDYYIEKYCNGVHGAVLNHTYRQIADTLHAFVRDCVENRSVRGLFLFRDRSIHGNPGYKIITVALDMYDDLIDKQYEIMGEGRPHDQKTFSEFNAMFEHLFETEE